MRQPTVRRPLRTAPPLIAAPLHRVTGELDAIAAVDALISLNEAIKCFGLRHGAGNPSGKALLGLL